MAADAGREIIGRDDELDVVAGFVGGATSLPAALLLRGEAGIGKTSLWRYGVEEAERHGQRVLAIVPGSSEAQLSFAGLGDLLEGILAGLEALPDPQRHALEVALLLADPGETPPDPRTIAVGALGLLKQVATDAPLVLAIDDVQWLDAASAGVVEFAVRRLRGEQIRLLVAERVVNRGEAPPLGLDRALGERLQRLHVGPLSLGALHRLLHSRLGLTLPRPALRRLGQACGGNPFFALEIGAVLKERGEALDPSAPLPIPDNVHELLRRRVEAFSARAREALLAAAATADANTAVVESVSSSAGVEEAIAAGVLLPDGPRLRFSHPLLAEAVYAQATPRRRRQLHRRLAGVLTDVEERALHLALAAEGSDAQVAEALDHAADLARSRGAMAAAARLLQEAARVTPAEDADGAARRTIAAANLWINAGGVRHAAGLAGPLAERLPAGRLRSDALVALARAVPDRAEFTALHERALEEAGDDQGRRAEILFNLCYARFHLNDLRSARETAYEALRAAELTGRSELRTLALGMAGRIETWMGLSHGAELLQRSLELEAESGPVDAYEGPGMWLGWWHLAGDELDESRRLLEQQYRRCTQAGDDYTRLWLCYPLTELECRAGRYAAAARFAELGYELAEQVESPYVLGPLLYARALVAAHTGDTDAARVHAEASRVAAGEINSALFETRHRVVLGVLGTSEGAYEEARSLLEPLYALRDEAGIDPDRFYSFWPDLVEALIALRELDRAAEIVTERERHAKALDRAGKQALAARCHALLAAADGSLDQATDALQEALALHELRPVPLERGRSLLALGRVQRRAKQKRSARESLDAALRIFDQLPAPLWAANARAELARIGGRTASRDELTESERRIATIVAEGKTNKETAAELFVSVHTVEAALTRVYRKLAVRSRSELASRLSEQSKL
jgi:DNA-binding CsgD family transcriptional regulator